MPRCYKPSLTLEGLKEKLRQLNRHVGSRFDVDRTQFETGRSRGPPASITLVTDSGTRKTLTIRDADGEAECAPDSIKDFLRTDYTIGGKGQDSFLQFIFQHVSDYDRTGCEDAAVAQGGAGGGGDPGGVGTSPNSSIWGTPPSTGAATPAAEAKKEESPPFRFSNSPRKNRRSRKTRKNSRKNSRRRHRTKQNRY
jgi:hypothetical protein